MVPSDTLAHIHFEMVSSIMRQKKLTLLSTVCVLYMYITRAGGTEGGKGGRVSEWIEGEGARILTQLYLHHS